MRKDAKVATLERLYIENRECERFVSDIVSLLGQLDDDIAWRALWLLRRATKDMPIPVPALIRVAESARAYRHWTWRLLMCQLFGTVQCPSSAREEFFPFLQDCFSDRRIIVRAWALSSMWLFRDDPDFRSRTLHCMRVARNDTGKSMQARLRRLVRQSNRPVKLTSSRV